MKIVDYINDIDKVIKKASKVFIMAHKYLDLDALGSSLGINEYVKTFGIKSTIIINDNKLEVGVKKAIDVIGDKYLIKRSSEIKNIEKDDLLIITDTNKKDLLQDPLFIDNFENIILIDHHDITDKTIKDGLVIIDEDSSSASEMVGELLEYKDVDIPKITADLLLAGIVLDTNNFVLNTTGNTFKICYYLTLNNADPNFAQYLLKQNIKRYFQRQAILTNVKVYGNIAITYSKSNQIYRREDLARVADTLIQFNNIEASFVIGKINKNEIGISSRSLGNIRVGDILEKFGGGGTEHNAGASIKNKRIKDVMLGLIKALNL